MNLDGDDDETHQDVLGVLASIPPHVPATFAPTDRDAFRDLTEQRHKVAPSSYELAVPKHRLEAFFPLPLAIKFVDAILDVDQEFECVAHCTASSFCHVSRSEHDVNRPSTRPLPPVNGTTWPKFHSALTSLLVNDSMFHLR
ncbi:hypothetical protein J1614_008289 [Plenodomus biglobosus]|nr:hypothetical protein J1614_008289 [Plenodomus biglobosus]